MMLDHDSVRKNKFREYFILDPAEIRAIYSLITKFKERLETDEQAAIEAKKLAAENSKLKNEAPPSWAAAIENELGPPSYKIFFSITRIDNSTSIEENIDALLGIRNAFAERIIELKIVLAVSDRFSLFRQELCECIFKCRAEYVDSEDDEDEIFADETNSFISITTKHKNETWVTALHSELIRQIERKFLKSKGILESIFQFFDEALPFVALTAILYFAPGFFNMGGKQLSDIPLKIILAAIPALTFFIFIAYMLASSNILKIFQQISRFIRVESVITIGDEEKRYQAREAWKSRITWTIIIGFIVSAAASFFQYCIVTPSNSWLK